MTMASNQCTTMMTGVMGGHDGGSGDANRNREIRTEGGTSIMPAFMEKYAHLKCVKVAYQRVSAARAERTSVPITARSPVADYISRPVTPYDTVTWTPAFQHFHPSRAFEVPGRSKVGKSIGTSQNQINEILIKGIHELNKCTTITDTFESYRRTLHLYYTLGHTETDIGELTDHHINENSDASTQTDDSGTSQENSNRNVSTQKDLISTGMQNKHTQTETDDEHNCQTIMDQPAVVEENSTRIPQRKRFGWNWTEMTTTLTSTALFGLTELLSSL